MSSPDPAHPEIIDRLFEHVLNGEAEQAAAEAGRALAEGVVATELLFEGMIPALEEVGRLFETGEVFLPEMLLSARAMQAAMDVLRPSIVAAGVEPIGRFVIGTVAGDIHDVGKKLVVVMLEGAGFEVFDLGINVPAERFVEAIEGLSPEVVGMSAFLTTTVGEFDRNISLIEKTGLRKRVKVLIGGAPVSQLTVEAVGADGFAPDASSAVRLTKAVLGIG